MMWRVQILGDSTDLDLLKRSFIDSDMKIKHEDGNYYVEASKFENLSAVEEVVKMANEHIAILSGIARLAYNARIPFMLGRVLHINCEKSKRDYLPCRMRITLWSR
ncbi:MAG TPA: hypothetical protein VK452_00965 [Dissulfurispiraceae bacterium]|nr:hypothetical protein [Dissulfurispiraceae bacterium]